MDPRDSMRSSARAKPSSFCRSRLSYLAASHRVAVLGDGATWGRYRDRDQFRVGLGALVGHGLGRCLRQFLRGRVLGLLGSPVGSR